jgi:hypothetical protein
MIRRGSARDDASEIHPIKPRRSFAWVYSFYRSLMIFPEVFSWEEERKKTEMDE